MAEQPEYPKQPFSSITDPVAEKAKRDLSWIADSEGNPTGGTTIPQEIDETALDVETMYVGHADGSFMITVSMGYQRSPVYVTQSASGAGTNPEAIRETAEKARSLARTALETLS